MTLFIYDYMKSAVFFQDCFKIKKQRNPLFSLKSWSNQLGLNSHGSLQQILAGRRLLPKKHLVKMEKSLQLKRDESAYLETLLNYERASSEEEKKGLHLELVKLKKVRESNNVTEVDYFDFFVNPLHAILLTLIARSDFRLDYDWIKEQLIFKTTLDEIRESVARLERFNLINIEKDRVILCQRSVKNRLDVPSMAVQIFHQKMAMYAASQVELQPPSQREFNSFSFNMDSKNISSAKEKIRNFLKDFYAEFECSEKGSSTYQFNLHLLKLSQLANQQEN